MRYAAGGRTAGNRTQLYHIPFMRLSTSCLKELKTLMAKLSCLELWVGVLTFKLVLKLKRPDGLSCVEIMDCCCFVLLSYVALVLRLGFSISMTLPEIICLSGKYILL